MKQKLPATALSAVQHQLLWEWGFQSMCEKPVSRWKEWDGITHEGGSSSWVSRCSKAMQLSRSNCFVFYPQNRPCCILMMVFLAAVRHIYKDEALEKTYHVSTLLCFMWQIAMEYFWFCVCFSFSSKTYSGKHEFYSATILKGINYVCFLLFPSFLLCIITHLSVML